VSDVARLQVLLEVGGIYVDTDSVILRSLDELRAHRMVLGEESDIDLGEVLCPSGSAKGGRKLRVFP